MNSPAQHYKNRILVSLPEAEIKRSPVVLEQEKTLFDGEVRHGYFLEQGIASVVVTAPFPKTAKYVRAW